MYRLRVSRSFVAQHYLTVPNSGPENEWHSHHFKVEVILEGEYLNENGYLVDITDVEEALGFLVDRYQDATLNDLPEFESLNPSVEHFSRIFTTSFEEYIRTEHLSRITTRIWEDEEAWASYTV
jgi:6-pyruvoyltetrahydropterin/6-carboxytetrahydropterin synthase